MRLLAEFDALLRMWSAPDYDVSGRMESARSLSTLAPECDTQVRALRSRETTTRAENEYAVRVHSIRCRTSATTADPRADTHSTLQAMGVIEALVALAAAATGEAVERAAVMEKLAVKATSMALARLKKRPALTATTVIRRRKGRSISSHVLHARPHVELER